MKINIESDFQPLGNPKSESASAQVGISRYTAKFTEGEVAFQFGLDRELQTVAQNTFVVKQRQSKDRTDLLRGAIRFENR